MGLETWQQIIIVKCILIMHVLGSNFAQLSAQIDWRQKRQSGQYAWVRESGLYRQPDIYFN